MNNGLAQLEIRQKQDHWKMDCIVGKPGSSAYPLELTERVTWQELIHKRKSKTKNWHSYRAVLDRHKRRAETPFITIIFKTITVVNGCKFLGWERTHVYYSHPYRGLERGSNEAQNILMRRFVPKGTDIGKLKHRDVKLVAL